MFPGRMNPKKMKQMMKQLGMEMEQLEGVKKIIITTGEGDYIFDEAEVVLVTMQGVTTYQITGTPVFEPIRPAISDEDVNLVVKQTGTTQERARAALAETGGDIAEAILRLAAHD
ncbi:MAG: nascent polypeptide-associated complex protein [Methanomicrobiales archaeon]|nr:nascent polypeptide-associated complex protein [Methanomicrobiales archaeon]